MEAQDEWAGEPDLEALGAAHDRMTGDPVRAMADLQVLAESGSLMSLVYLGYMHEAGLGGEISLSKADEFYQRAFEQGTVSGAFSLARTAWKRGDYKKAEQYFSWGAERNDPRAMYWLADRYLRETTNSDRLENAVGLLERASSLGHLQSTRRLGRVLMRGHFGLRKIFYGFWIYVSTAFRAAFIATRNPASNRLLDLPLE